MKKITITMTASVVLFLSSLQLSSAESLKTYAVVKYNKKIDSLATIYNDPTTHSAMVSVLPSGSKGVVAIARPRKYSEKLWQNVSWQNKTGWMLSKYLVYDKETSKKVNKQACHVKDIKVCL